VQEQLTAQARRDRVGKILGKLKERVSFDLPSILVDRAIHNQMHELDNMLRRMGANLEEYLDSRQITIEELREEMRPRAEERVKEELLLEAVARHLNFTVTDDEIRESLRPTADALRQSVEQMFEALAMQGDLEMLRTGMLIGKATDYLATTVRTDDAR
jgi:trigger factor